MKLNQPYYIEPRNGKRHLDLNGDWDFFYADETREEFCEELWIYKTKIPNSVYRSLFEAGILPDPYVGTNSKLYHWVDEKVWYYRKKFRLSKAGFSGNAFLCFDGIAYFSRVWVNGVLLGEHEGMFGGPVCDIAMYLELEGENEIIVEVKSCNYGEKDTFDFLNRKGVNRQIVPWNIARDTQSSTGDFIVIGIWNRVRIEFTDRLHMSRPYIYTKYADDRKAELFLEFEIADGTVEELQPFFGYDDETYNYMNSTYAGLTGSVKDETVDIHIAIAEKGSDTIVYESKDTVNLTDYDNLGMLKEYHELQYFSKTISIADPKLWYPVGLGEARLYEVTIALYSQGKLCDQQVVNTGIRTFTARRTAGKKYKNRWNDYRFAVNGKEFFINGINWLPVDYLYSIDPAEYEWALVLAKNAGVQMFRVWSGGGMPETDTFYDLCDRLGIMVMQDNMLANVIDTRGYPQDILESQEAYNIYRTRNHPSLVWRCGGNEHNPYNKKLAESMFVISRVVKNLDPSRIFQYAAMDGGSAHVYLDMDPAWYRRLYKDLPFLDETGIHSLPAYKTLKKLINEKECTALLPEVKKEFKEQFPELLNHFTEYNSGMGVRMFARASQISDRKLFTLEELCEASHVQAYEFYLLMIQGVRANYPNCGGILLWAYKRPWTTAAVQVVDGMGQPTYPYYAMLQTYQPLNIALKLDWTVIAPLQEVALNAVIFNQNNEDINEAQIKVTVYRPDMTIEKEQCVFVENCRREYAFEAFRPDESYTDQCFLINIELRKDGKTLSCTTYTIKCTSQLADEAFREKYTAKPHINLSFPNGPWLKTGIQNARKATLSARILEEGNKGSYRYVDVRIENTSEVAAYPVTIDIVNESARFYVNDNFFLLKPGEIKEIRITCDGLGEGEKPEVEISAWNTWRINL